MIAWKTGAARVNTILPYLVLGISAGSVYGLAGCGLVLTYKTSKVFNFVVRCSGNDRSVHLLPAGFDPSPGVVPLRSGGRARLRRGDRPADGAVGSTTVEDELGAADRGDGRLAARYRRLLSTGARQPNAGFSQYLPNSTFVLGGAHVTYGQVIVTVAGLLVTIVLYAYFRVARLGVAMRGVVENPDLLAISGTSRVKVRRWAWVIGSVVACLAGVLLAPSVNLDALILTLLICRPSGRRRLAVSRACRQPTSVASVSVWLPLILTKYINTSGTILSGLPASLPLVSRCS